MIQRQQSLWLLLCAICAFLSFKLPFYAGGTENVAGTAGGAVSVEAGSSLFLLVFTGLCMLLSLITIFLYKDRKLQLKLCITGLILSILIIVFYFVEIKSQPAGTSGTLALSSIFVLLLPVGYGMALRGIWKDEKLVKSLDKLR